MSLVDEARAMQQNPGNSCAMQAIRAKDPALYAEILDALASDISCAAISRALDKRGARVSRVILERHRKNECIGCRP